MAFVDVLTIRMEEFEGGKIGLSNSKANVGTMVLSSFSPSVHKIQDTASYTR